MTIQLTITDPRLVAIGCIRVSTDRQADAYGPDRQRQQITSMAERARLELVHWVEESVSGADHSRAVENEFYALARLHPGLNFVFAHPNRLGRHVEVIVGIARTLLDLGANVWIADLGTLSEDRIWLYFLRDAAEAEVDYRRIVHQLNTGKRSKATSGQWPHGDVPWGYVLQRDHRGRSMLPVPDPAVAPTIQRIFDLAEQMGSTRIQTILNKEGVPSPKGGGRWSRASIRQYLSNARYTGRADFQGITVTFEAIISPEQFQRVQERLRTRLKQSGPRDTSLLWAGHVRCASCGGAIGRDAHSAGTRTYVYYRCWRGRRSVALRDAGQEPCAHSRNHPVLLSDERWWAYFTEHITRPDLLAEIVAPPQESPQVAANAERRAELKAAIARSWEPYTAGMVTLDVAEVLARPYQQQLRQLDEEAQREPARATPAFAALATQFAQAVQGDLSFADRRALLNLLDVNLYVGPDGPSTLTINLP